jgi:TRAP-type mannitol/chloroaromatic compound transport system substrate-binding protein
LTFLFANACSVAFLAKYPFFIFYHYVGFGMIAVIMLSFFFGGDGFGDCE